MGLYKESGCNSIVADVRVLTDVRVCVRAGGVRVCGARWQRGFPWSEVFRKAFHVEDTVGTGWGCMSLVSGDPHPTHIHTHHGSVTAECRDCRCVILITVSY